MGGGSEAVGFHLETPRSQLEQMAKKTTAMIPSARIERAIIFIRGQKV
jgi:hypothetical protein